MKVKSVFNCSCCMLFFVFLITLLNNTSSQVLQKTYTFGKNDHGQIGDGTYVNKNVPNLVGNQTFNIKKISTGHSHVLILTTDSKIFSFGNNENGQLGLGNQFDYNSPTEITTPGGFFVSDISTGFKHSLILSDNSKVYCVGNNQYGQLGDSTQINRTSFVELINPTSLDVSKISAGGYHSIILTNLSNAFSFGHNEFGQLGDNSTIHRNIPVSLKFSKFIVQIACGFYHSIILSSEKKLYTFGRNNYGQLGDNSTLNRDSPIVPHFTVSNPTQISAGYHHSMILLKNSDVLTFGRNVEGQLGDGSNVDRLTGVNIKKVNERIIQISAGGSFSAILKKTIYCWGYSQFSAQVCSGFGVCSDSNNCTCNTGHFGYNCNDFMCNGINSTFPSVCSGNGTCNGYNNCTCNSGFYGSNCENSIVDCHGKQSNSADVCSGNGICHSLNNCSCFNNYSGMNCNITSCNGIENKNTSVCSSNGKCFSYNNCTCNAGRGGSNCESPGCFGKSENDPNVCSGKGVCIGGDECECPKGYFGEQCEYHSCGLISSNDPKTCSGRGTCVAMNQCNCIDARYFGETCQVTTCSGVNSNDTSVCNSFGTCTDFNTCSCIQGKTGSTCEINICGGKLQTDPTVCSGKAACSGPNICECPREYNGDICQYKRCFDKYENDAEVCSGRGTCDVVDSCSCRGSYSGNQCEFSYCFGLNSSNPQICSGNGECLTTNNCTCSTHFIGTKCDVFVPYYDTEIQYLVVILCGMGVVLFIGAVIGIIVFTYVVSKRLKRAQGFQSNVEDDIWDDIKKPERLTSPREKPRPFISEEIHNEVRDPSFKEITLDTPVNNKDDIELNNIVHEEE
eukprot:gene10768-3387_t